MITVTVVPNDWTDRRAVWGEEGVDLAGLKEPRVTWGEPANPREGPILEGKLPQTIVV